MKIAELILSFLQQPILVLDGSLQPIFANPAFFKMFDQPLSELDGNVIHELIYGEICQPSIQKVIDSLNTHGCGSEVVCRLGSGPPKHLWVQVCKIQQDDLPEMFLVELRDITKEKEVEFNYHELNATLQQHVATVDAVNEELESYSHSVSHDLRTPLRFVSRIAHLLLHEPGTNLSDVATQRVSMILQATEEMGTLIENLLIFSQVNREPIKKNM